MNQMEIPLSILLTIAAIAYAFMYNDSVDGFTAVENNIVSGYTIEAAELSTGYNVNGTNTCKIDIAQNHDLNNVDSIVQFNVDTLIVTDDTEEKIDVEMITTDEGE